MQPSRGGAPPRVFDGPKSATIRGPDKVRKHCSTPCLRPSNTISVPSLSSVFSSPSPLPSTSSLRIPPHPSPPPPARRPVCHGRNAASPERAASRSSCCNTGRQPAHRREGVAICVPNCYAVVLPGRLYRSQHRRLQFKLQCLQAHHARPRRQALARDGSHPEFRQAPGQRRCHSFAEACVRLAVRGSSLYLRWQCHQCHSARIVCSQGAMVVRTGPSGMMSWPICPSLYSAPRSLVLSRSTSSAPSSSTACFSSHLSTPSPRPPSLTLQHGASQLSSRLRCSPSRSPYTRTPTRIPPSTRPTNTFAHT
jgi:hypothetical protein